MKNLRWAVWLIIGLYLFGLLLFAVRPAGAQSFSDLYVELVGSNELNISTPTGDFECHSTSAWAVECVGSMVADVVDSGSLAEYDITYVLDTAEDVPVCIVSNDASLVGGTDFSVSSWAAGAVPYSYSVFGGRNLIFALGGSAGFGATLQSDIYIVMTTDLSSCSPAGFDSDPYNAFWFRWFSGIIFIATGMYFEGLFFFFILPYLFAAYPSDYALFIGMTFVILLIIGFYRSIWKVRYEK